MLTSLLVLVAFMVLTAVALERAIDKRMLRAEEDKLEAQMYGLLAAIDRDDNGNSITVSNGRVFETALFNPESGLHALIYADSGEIWRSLSTLDSFPQPTDLAREELRFSVVDHEQGHWFQLAFSIQWPDANDRLQPYQVILWKTAEEYFEQFKKFRQILWLWFGITITLLLVVMWLVSFWSLRPLRVIGDEVRAIEDGKKQRFDSDYPSEIQPLTQNLNLLLQREEHQMTRYRNALDDLAHSLKTPLAVLTGLSEENSTSLDQRESLKLQTQRMNQIVSYQLQKAATVGGDLISKPVDLGVLLKKTVDGLVKVYRSKGIEITLESEPGLSIRMDESDLYEVVGNLTDNACKYGQSRVLVTAGKQGRLILLSIEDDGDGLEPDQMATIMTRGTRLDQSKEGQGIGLAVVKEIVTAYEIKVDLTRSSLGGLKIELEFTNSR